MKYNDLRIKWKILIPFFIISIIFGIGLYFYFSTLYKDTLHNGLVEKAKTVILSAESAREFTSEQLKRDVFRKDITDIDDFLYKVPIFSAMKIAQEKSEELGFVAKVPKFQPRNPDNEPDEFEAQVLKQLENGDGKSALWKVDEETNQLRYFKPVVLTQECMICHGDPNKSFEYWGRNDGKDITGTRMEGWKVGEIHGAFEIMMDLGPVDAQVSEKSLIIALISLTLTVLFVFIAFFIANVISKPLHLLESASAKIANGDVDFDLSIDSKDETGNLAIAFKNIRNKLKTLISESNNLSTAAKNGELDKRANHEGLEGGYKDILIGFNSTLDEVVLPLNVAAQNLELISNGEIPKKISNKAYTNSIAIQSVNKLIDRFSLIIEEIDKISNESVNGNLSSRIDTSKFVGDYKNIMLGINNMLETILNPINESIMVLEEISLGNISKQISSDFKGDHDKIKKAVNSVANTLQSIHHEIILLNESAKNGDLKKRGDASKFKGAYSELILGTNTMLDAIVTPLKLQAEYIDRISKGILPDTITDNFNGDFEILKTNLNTLINNLKQFIADMEKMSELHDKGEIDFFIDSDKYKGFYQTMSKGVNEMVEGHINVKKMAINVFNEYGKGNFEANIAQLPGKKAFINDAINSVQSNLKSINSEINNLITQALEGNLSYRSDSSRFNGDWVNIIEGINKMLDEMLSPINETIAVLEEMSRGNLSVQINSEFKGDHSKLKDAINKTVELMPFNEAISVLSSLASGDLTTEMHSDYKGDSLKMKQAVNSTIYSINDILMQVKTMVDEVSQGSLQVSDASSSLSQGATEQAASLEQITSSMDTVGSQIKATANNAIEAQDLTNEAKKFAEKGDNEMQNLNKAMIEISTSSQNISKIIKAIDEIAFQTNLLALNAAVEAARAGRHGKGFAVVAEEVRNLAARSAKAAKETSDLIEQSIKTVDNGVDIAHKTADVLKQIRIGAEKSAGIVSEIAISANEQAEGVLQINEGLKQIDQVTQTNTASAEESASAAEELSGQANQLKELISSFRLRRIDYNLLGNDLQLDRNKNKMLGQ